MKRLGFAVWVPVALGLGFTTEVLAQQAQAGAESVSALQEVIVTATKRSTNVQDTPISITAARSAP